MSASHWWFSTLPDAAEERRLAPRFREAAREAALSPVDETVLGYWDAHAERLSSAWARAASQAERLEHGERYNAYISAFNRPGFTELAAEVARTLSAETCFRFVIVGRCTPGAVLWHALGRERAGALPGDLGNVLVPSTEVPAALAATEAAIAGVSPERALARGMALAGHSNDEATIRAVLTHLPDGLRAAAEARKAFMALAMPER